MANAETNARRALDIFSDFERLRSDGWTLESTLASAIWTSSSYPTIDDLLLHLGVFDIPLHRFVLTAKYGEASFEVLIGDVGQHTVRNQSTDDLTEIFSLTDVVAARAVWAGDAKRIGELPAGAWTASIHFRLDDGFAAEEEHWSLVATTADLDLLLAEAPFWTWRPAFGDEMPRVYVVWDAPGSYLRTGSTLFAGLGIDWARQLSALDRRPSFRFAQAVLSGAPDPSMVFPHAVGGSHFVRLSDRLRRAAAALAWTAFATEVRVVADAGLEIEIFGFQRTSYEIEPTGLVASEAQATASLRLFEWAARNDSPDHLLAVRQVASLRFDDPPWNRSSDVQAAAEPIFFALRSDAVADVMKSRRELQSLVSSTALGAAERAAGLARAAVERTAALLLALAGVIVSQSLNAISAELAVTLRIFIAIGLAGLALWNILFEGGFATLPIKNLKRDLPKLANLLPQSDLDAILSMACIASTQRKAIVTRVAVPALLLVCAGIALFAH